MKTNEQLASEAVSQIFARVGTLPGRREEAHAIIHHCLTQAQEGREGGDLEAARKEATEIWQGDVLGKGRNIIDILTELLAARPIPSPGAEGDTKRLDWLDENMGKVVPGSGDARYWILGQKEFAPNKATNIRAAIDAAMSTQEVRKGDAT